MGRGDKGASAPARAAGRAARHSSLSPCLPSILRRLSVEREMGRAKIDDQLYGPLRCSCGVVFSVANDRSVATGWGRISGENGLGERRDEEREKKREKGWGG
uniref:Uncharacterized protein n=1 Tax=Plectus sambesii TaxID=2011161 RepID=A0A914WP39_9BILA